MNTEGCCHKRGRAGDSSGGPAWVWQRAGEVLGQVVPGVILVAMPKCPVCLATYVTAFTGLGLSFTTATYVRTALLICCIAAMLLMGVKNCGRFVAAKRSRLNDGSFKPNEE
ncbi:MAG TPA: hypothetical protein VL793_06395 [Patescibacteria group bacterium]|nr:hypothetical protein [Patescibacteria group bacterium]